MRAALRVGAAGYLLKDMPPGELVDGGAGRRAGGAGGDGLADAPADELSVREREVLELIGQRAAQPRDRRAARGERGDGQDARAACAGEAAPAQSRGGSSVRAGPRTIRALTSARRRPAARRSGRSSSRARAPARPRRGRRTPSPRTRDAGRSGPPTHPTHGERVRLPMGVGSEDATRDLGRRLVVGRDRACGRVDAFNGGVEHPQNVWTRQARAIHQRDDLGCAVGRTTTAEPRTEGRPRLSGDPRGGQAPGVPQGRTLPVKTS